MLIGVSGGIAAYKTAALVSQLAQAGAGVTVVLTAAAEKFVGAATFAALSSRPVLKDIFDADRHPLGAHIELARRADLLCVSPATANFLAQAAHGLAFGVRHSHLDHHEVCVNLQNVFVVYDFGSRGWTLPRVVAFLLSSARAFGGTRVNEQRRKEEQRESGRGDQQRDAELAAELRDGLGG